jgi:hypothetical protein
MMPASTCEWVGTVVVGMGVSTMNVVYIGENVIVSVGGKGADKVTAAVPPSNGAGSGGREGGVVAIFRVINGRSQWSAALRGGWLQGEIDRLGPTRHHIENSRSRVRSMKGSLSPGCFVRNAIASCSRPPSTCRAVTASTSLRASHKRPQGHQIVHNSFFLGTRVRCYMLHIF